MRTVHTCFAMVSIIFCMTLCACSGGKEAQLETESRQSASDRSVDGVRGYAKTPLDKARAAQQAGEARTEAIDRALRKQ